MKLQATARFAPRGDLGRFVAAKVTPAVRASVQAAGELVQQSAMSHCPVRTGALRDSITVDLVETDSTIQAIVAPHQPYAFYVEYGTGRRGDPVVPHNEDWPGMDAQPYMRPAVDEAKPVILDLFRSNLSTALSS